MALTRTRRIGIFLSGIVFAALTASALLWLPSFSHRFVLVQLARVLGREVTAEAVRFRFFPAEIEIRQLRVPGARPGDAAWLEVPRLSMRPSVGLLWEGRLVLSRVRLERPIVRIQAFADAGDNIPRLHVAGGGPMALRIRRLTVESGVLMLDHRRVPLTLDLPELTGALAGRRAGVLAGDLVLGPGEARFGSAPPILVSTTLKLLLDGPRLVLEGGRVRTARSDLAVAGELRLATEPQGRFHVEGAIDLAELDRHVTETGFHLTGASRYRGDLDVLGSQLSLAGRIEGEDGSWSGADVPRFRGEVDWGPGGVRLKDLDLDAFGGTSRLQLEVPRQGTAHLAATFSGVDAERTVAHLFDIGMPGLGGRATGAADLAWPRGRFRDLSGRASVEVAALEDGRAPVRGQFTWSAVRGIQTLERVDLATPETHVLMHGSIARDQSSEIALAARSSDLAVSDALVHSLRRALGNGAAIPFAVAGAGSFDGHWRGTLRDPRYEGRFVGTGIRYLGVDWGHMEWVGSSQASEVACRSLVLRRGGSEMWIDGTFEPGEYGQRDKADARMRFRDWPAEDLARAFEWQVRWSGQLSGQATITGRRSLPWGPTSITSRRGVYEGIPYESLDAEALLQGDRIEVTRGKAVLGGGTAQFAGTRTDAGVYDGRTEITNVEIGGLVPPPRPGVAWGGHISGTVTLKGTLAQPLGSAQLTAPRLFLGEEGVGALTASLEGRGDGVVHVEARCESPRTHVDLTGAVDASAPFAASLTARTRATSVDPILCALLPAGADWIPAIIASGEVSVHGPLAQLADADLTAALAEVQVLIPDYPVQNAEPVLLALERGRLVFDGVRLRGEGTNLLASGDAALLREGRLHVTVRGDADLRSLAAITRRLKARGAAELSLELTGTRDAPRLDGTLAVQGAGVRVASFPHGLEDVHGTVSFTERGARLRDLVGRLGGGEVVLDGEAAYGRAGLLSFDVKLAGRDIALRYPEGLRSVTGAKLRLFGDGERQWVTGSVDVREAVWTRRYDVASEILAPEDAIPMPKTPLGEALRFDVKVSAPGTLRVDNNLATLDARADLRLQGTSDSPVVVGRADVDRGRVYFQGNTYVIRRGRIEFTNPQRMNPFFDIEAETRVRSYRVHLKVNGTLDRVYPTLTSDPPLSAVQILNLLAGAPEEDVLRLAQAQTDQTRLGEQGAATLVAGRIAEGMGLERRAERLFGLNRFSIDPSVLKGSITDPAARLTVGKRLTPDINVLYSTDLRGNEQRMLSLEYTLKDWLSVLMTRGEPGGFGVDVRYQPAR